MHATNFRRGKKREMNQHKDLQVCTVSSVMANPDLQLKQQHKWKLKTPMKLLVAH